jgi:ribosomal protein S12 methylthiotransferase accessory factor
LAKSCRERYCCSVCDADDLVCGSVADLRDEHELCTPQQFALFHPDQPGRFPRPDEQTPIAWAWGWSLSHQRPVLAPASLIYMPYFPQFREQGEQVAGPAISTGLSCATSVDEAVLKGICECVERDAFMITWMNRLPVPRVKIESNPLLRQLYDERLRRDGLHYVLLRTTTDIPIPSFLCLLIDERRSPPMICAGGAASLDPVLAAQKAMTEAVQTREWAKFLGGRNPKFNFSAQFDDIRDFEDHVRLYGYGNMMHAIEFLLGETGAPLDDCWESSTTGSTKRDLERVVAILADGGMDVIALDLTTPDVAQCGLHVTRALVPELQPLDADYLHRFLGGRRLYDVPRRMGYTNSSTTIESLNPYPHPYP